MKLQQMQMHPRRCAPAQAPRGPNSSAPAPPQLPRWMHRRCHRFFPHRRRHESLPRLRRSGSPLPRSVRLEQLSCRRRLIFLQPHGVRRCSDSGRRGDRARPRGLFGEGARGTGREREKRARGAERIGSPPPATNGNDSYNAPQEPSPRVGARAPAVDERGAGEPLFPP